MNTAHKLSVVEIALIFATIVTITFVGFAVYRASNNMVKETNSTRQSSGVDSSGSEAEQLSDGQDTQQQQNAEDVSVPESKDELEQAEKSLNDINFDQQLDSDELTLQES